MLVQANFNEEGYYYPATVLGSSGADQYDVIYLDGSRELVGAGSMIPDDLLPGAIVEVLITDVWIEGMVSHRSGVAVGVEFEHMSARWASMILIRRNPERGVIVRLKGERTEAPLNLSRFGDTSAYCFASIVERSNDSATMLYLDGTWEERPLSDVVEATVSPGSAVYWSDGSEQFAGRMVRTLGRAAEIVVDGVRRWVSLAHIYQFSGG